MAIRTAHPAWFAWATLVRGVEVMVLAWQRRRMIGRLGMLDDRLLADIGITRQDVLSVLAEPFLVDPSAKLARRANEARRARRASALETRAFAKHVAGEPRTPRRAA